MLADFRAGGCFVCGEVAACCLDAHHIGEKEFGIANVARHGIAIKRIVEELKKCVCVCTNCHRKVHGGLLSLRTGARVTG